MEEAKICWAGVHLSTEFRAGMGMDVGRFAIHVDRQRYKYIKLRICFEGEIESKLCV